MYKQILFTTAFVNCSFAKKNVSTMTMNEYISATIVKLKNVIIV